MGELVVVGTGIRSGVQLTVEARRCIESADRVFYLVTEPLTSVILDDLNPHAESLAGLYAPTKDRAETYAEMVAVIMEAVRRGQRVCAAFYGHPGVFVHPGHEAVRRARLEGYRAEMLPGISAEDCLFADLGIDPGARGCQSYLAEDFLLRPRSFDTRTLLILWQIVAIGDPAVRQERDPRGVEALAKLLAGHYGSGHEVILYTAAVYPVGTHSELGVTIADLPHADIDDLATLVVPPLGAPEIDRAMADHLGLDRVARSESSSA